MAQRRSKDLRLVLDSPMLAWALFGNVASAVFVALGLVAATALGATPLVFLAAGVVFLLTALTYVEGMSALPQAGGSSNFARRAFNELASFFAGWALLLDYLMTVAISAFFAGEYLSRLPGMSWLDDGPRKLIFGIALIATVTLVDMRNIRAAVRISVFVSIAALLIQVTLGVVGVALLFNARQLQWEFEPSHWPGWHGVLQAVPVAMLGFTGFDVVSTLAEETRTARKLIPQRCQSEQQCLQMSLRAYELLLTQSLDGFTMAQDGLKSEDKAAHKFSYPLKCVSKARIVSMYALGASAR